MDYMPMYIGTIAMFVFCAILIYAIYKVTKIVKMIRERDALYLERLDNLESIVKKDIKNILELLKK